MLKLGSKGKDVLLVQQQLEALGFSPGPLDGDFGPRTEKAVRSFQEARGLVVDGIVGPRTNGKLQRGLDELAAQATEHSVMSGLIVQPLKMRQVKSLDELGNPRSKTWQRNHLASFAIGPGFPMTRLFCHREFGPVLQQVFIEINGEGYAKTILSYYGCYSLRLVRGGTTWSAHAYGAAIDLNVPQNPLGAPVRAARDCSTGEFHHEHPVVKIFKRHGCFWGGDFRHRKDKMHFCGCGRH